MLKFIYCLLKANFGDNFVARLTWVCPYLLNGWSKHSKTTLIRFLVSKNMVVEHSDLMISEKKPIFRLNAYAKNSFWQISRKPSDLACMLLHNSYINVIIAHILVYSKSLYDLRGPSWHFCPIALEGRGRPEFSPSN